MNKISGSPRGTIHIYNADGTCSGPSEDEIAEKEDPRGSIGDQLQELQDGDSAGKTRSKIERSRAAETFYHRDMHPYIDTNPRDDSKHIFAVYPETIGDRNIDGYYYVVVDELGLKAKPTMDFWGSSYDFVEKLIHEIPELDKLILNVCDNKVSNSVIKVIERELWKKGVEMSSGTPLHTNRGVVDKESPPKKEKNLTVGDLAKAVEDPAMRSMMQDPYHKTRGQKLSSRVSRILKIAWHVIQTPADEVKSPDDRWSIVPDKPSEEHEQEAKEKFKTRDDAVARLNELEGRPPASSEEDKIENEDKDKIENTEEGELKNAGELHQANVLGEWLDPEKASRVAWSLRSNGNKSLGDWE